MADLMSWPKIIAIHCEKLNAQVNVTVTKWEPDRNYLFISRISGLTIALRGTEHIGFSRRGFAEVAAEVARQTNRDLRA